MIKDLPGAFDENILANGETDVAFISQENFRSLLGGEYDSITAKNEAFQALKKVQILRGLDYSTLHKIMDAMKLEEYLNNELIVEQNDPGNAFFILKSGVAEVIKDGIILRTITKHDYFGERSLLFNDFRSATVRAKEKVVV